MRPRKFEVWWILVAVVVLLLALAPLLSLFRSVFLVIAVTGIWLFAATVARRLSALRSAPNDLPFDHVARRLWRVFVEVLLQWRVVRDRPLVGVLHAFVLWGFCAFAWISVKHLALGIHGLGAATDDHTWYGAFVAFWAIAVSLGMLGLAFRRFVLRPKVLGHLSATSGMVAALIVLLMATYLLNWGIYPPGSTAWNVTWWVHTVAFFGLLVLIPQSKHLHLVLAPFAIFFRSEGTSEMRPLRDDDTDFGMIHFSELRAKDVLDVNACVECGRCTQICPVNRIGWSLDPKGIILAMQKGLVAGEDRIAGSAAECGQGAARVAEEDLFQCLSCGACEYTCPVGIEHVGKKILDLRRGLVSEGRVGNEKLVTLFTTMERSPGNPWGIGQDTRRKFVAKHKLPIFDGTQEWLFWLGCGLSYDSHGQSVALAMQEILSAAGVSFGIFEEENCCGEPARRAGNEYLYLQLAENLVAKFGQQKVRNILVCCPHCATMFDKDYRQIAAYGELGIRVVHHSELIVALLPKLNLQQEAKTVSYHDPCYLARSRGVTDAPRKVLQACGLNILEPAHHGQNTSCCGAGGAQLFIADDTKDRDAERVNQARFAEIKGTGASMAAVACPYCPIMLRDAAIHARQDEFEILDIAEITARNLRQGAAG